MLPDGEQVAKAWAKANTAIAAIVGDHVSSRLPSNLGAEGTMPWLRVFKIPGTSPDPTGAFDIVALQWDAFAEGAGDDRGSPNIKLASKLIRTVEAEILDMSESLATLVDVDGTPTAIIGAAVTVGHHRLPEPDTGWARMRTDTLFTIRAG